MFVAVSSAVIVSPFWHWLRHLRGPGLLLLGLADNSIIPLTGSMDVFTIWLAAHQQHLWWYYAIMASAGAILGGYITYVLARRGGREAMERRLSRKTARRLSRGFERWGFFAVAIPALLPPPFPMVPFLLAAGALQYPQGEFLLALAVGRTIRFTIVAALGAIYGAHIVKFFAKYYAVAFWTLVALAVFGGLFSLLEYWSREKKLAAR